MKTTTPQHSSTSQDQEWCIGLVVCVLVVSGWMYHLAKEHARLVVSQDQGWCIGLVVLCSGGFRLHMYHPAEEHARLVVSQV